MTTPADSEFYIARIADLKRPHHEFMALIQRMASGTYQPGSALNRSAPQAPKPQHIANAIGNQRKAWIRSMIRDGLTTRNIATVTGMGEAEIETQRDMQTTRHHQRVLVIRNS